MRGSQLGENKAGSAPIFKAANDAEARAIMTADPAVAKGVMRAELFPYRVAVFA